MDLILKFKEVNLHQMKSLAIFLGESDIPFEEIDPIYYPTGWPDNHMIGPDSWRTSEMILKDFQRQVKGEWLGKCLFDGLDKSQPYSLSCNCPKCSPQCSIEGGIK